MHNFELSIKNDYQKRYRMVGWMIITVNFFTTLWMLFAKSSEKILLIELIVLIILFFNYLTKKINNKKKLIFFILLTAIVWLTYSIYWLASIDLLYIFIVSLAMRDLKIIITEAEITYPSFPVKKILWQQVDNLCVKDGLLTIDLKNNKILQTEIVDFSSATPFNEESFNQFCKEQISTSNKYNVAD